MSLMFVLYCDETTLQSCVLTQMNSGCVCKSMGREMVEIMDINTSLTHNHG